MPENIFTRGLLCYALAAAVGCGTSKGPAPGGESAPSAGTQGAAAAGGEESVPATPSPYEALPPEARTILEKPFTGDLDEMVKRRLIRAGVVFNRTQYYIDKGVQRGLAYDSIQLFEEELNKRLKTGLLKVHIAIVPLSRDQLFPSLEAGKVDFIAAALTKTPERMKRVDFSNPTRQDVSEIPVTAAGVAPVATTDDLSGREVFVRKSSSYYESLIALNQSLAAKGKAPVVIKEAPEPLEDDDLLEMVNAGLVEITIVDDFLVDFWKQVFPDIRPQRSAAVRSGERSRSACARTTRRCSRRRTPGSRSTGRARPSATSWSDGTSRTPTT